VEVEVVASLDAAELSVRLHAWHTSRYSTDILQSVQHSTVVDMYLEQESHDPCI
jgi:hypothetical protein